MKKVLLTVGEGGDAGYISDVLIEHGAASVSVSDANAGETLEEKPIENWRESVVQAWFMPEVNVENVAMMLAADFGITNAQLDFYDPENDNSWVDEWRKYVRPINIEETNTRIYYSESDRQETPGVINLHLEIGASFGSGHHITTQLCLRWMERNLSSGITLLDYGCGNGVLAVRAALHAPNIHATGIDIDERAAEEARRNAARNSVDHLTKFYTKPPQDNMEYDVVVANILAVTLKKLAPVIVASLRPGGTLVLSGMLVSQAADVTDVYKKLGVVLEECLVDQEWALLVGMKS